MMRVPCDEESGHLAIYTTDCFKSYLFILITEVLHHESVNSELRPLSDIPTSMRDSSFVKSAGLATVRTSTCTRCKHELLTFILAPTAPTSLRLRRSVK